MICRRGCVANYGAASGVGQDQDWYLARFLGTDADVNIATRHPEFREWKWIEPAELPDLIVPFKRDLYRQLLSEFSEYL